MSKNIKQSIIFIVSLAILLIVYTPSSFAQNLPKQNLKISPIIQNITLIPGTTTTFPVTIENLADKPLGMHIDISSFDPENPEQALSPISNRSLVPWTTVLEKDLLLGEHEQKTVLVSIVVPPHSNGGYYETLAYTPFISGLQTVHSPIILSKFLGFVFATVGEANLAEAVKYMTVTHFAPKAYVIDHGNPIIQFTVQNNYKTHVIGKPFVTITPLFGQPQTVQLEEKYVFPGTMRTWETAYSLPMNIFYRATLSLSIGAGNIVTAHTWFVLLPYKFVLACIIAVALLLVALLRKRIAKSVGILFNG